MNLAGCLASSSVYRRLPTGRTMSSVNSHSGTVLPGVALITKATHLGTAMPVVSHEYSLACVVCGLHAAYLARFWTSSMMNATPPPRRSAAFGRSAEFLWSPNSWLANLRKLMRLMREPSTPFLS